MRGGEEAAGRKDNLKGKDGVEELGYRNFAEVVKDVDRVMDLIWISGTRTFSPPLCFFVTSQYARGRCTAVIRMLI